MFSVLFLFLQVKTNDVAEMFFPLEMDAKVVVFAYAPYDDPKVSFAIVSPDVSHSNGYSQYQSNINKRLADRVSKKYFEFYQ